MSRAATTLKAPLRLVREEDGVLVALACATCGRVYGLDDSFADRCCNRRCADCETALPVRHPYTVCDQCRPIREAKRDAELRAKATRIPESEYSGPVYVDGAWNDGYLRDTDELREWAADSEAPVSLTEVWACTTRRLQLPDAERLCEDMTQDSFEDAYDQLVGIEELQIALDAFNAAQTAEEWDVDHSRLVVLAVPIVEAPNSDAR